MIISTCCHLHIVKNTNRTAPPDATIIEQREFQTFFALCFCESIYFVSLFTISKADYTDDPLLTLAVCCCKNLSKMVI